jgi:hypothetical protein
VVSIEGVVIQVMGEEGLIPVDDLKTLAMSDLNSPQPRKGKKYEEEIYCFYSRNDCLDYQQCVMGTRV